MNTQAQTNPTSAGREFGRQPLTQFSGSNETRMGVEGVEYSMDQMESSVVNNSLQLFFLGLM